MCCMLVLPTCFLFTACNKDDDEDGEEPQTTLTETIAGTYSVTINVTLKTGGEDMPADPTEATVIITPTNESTVKMELQGFKFIETEIPLSLEGIKATGSKEDIRLSFNGAITAEALADLGEITGTLSGGVKTKEMDLMLNLKVVDAEMDVVVGIKGTKSDK